MFASIVMLLPLLPFVAAKGTFYTRTHSEISTDIIIGTKNVSSELTCVLSCRRFNGCVKAATKAENPSIKNGAENAECLYLKDSSHSHGPIIPVILFEVEELKEKKQEKKTPTGMF